MRRLFLLRHAKSSWDDPTLADIDRPLAPRGRRAAKAMAAHLRESETPPELVLCSPSRRTRQTLDRIAPSLGRGTVVRIEPELYEASAATLLKKLRELPDDVGSVMLIAHNPGTQDLALSLATTDSESPEMVRKFPTAALATMEPEVTWRDLAPGRAKLVSFVRPKDLSGGE